MGNDVLIPGSQIRLGEIAVGAPSHVCPAAGPAFASPRPPGPPTAARGLILHPDWVPTIHEWMPSAQGGGGFRRNNRLMSSWARYRGRTLPSMSWGGASCSAHMLTREGHACRHGVPFSVCLSLRVVSAWPGHGGLNCTGIQAAS